MNTKLFYIDDSGTVNTGCIVYAWVEIDVIQWHTALARWLDYRKNLKRTEGIPVAYELHATQFVRGRGNPSGIPGWNRSRANRGRVAQASLDTITSMPGTQVGAVYRRTTKLGSDFHHERADLYGQLLRSLDRRLRDTEDHGIIVMDGNGSDSSYRRKHRTLDLHTRHIVEDPFFSGSDTNQPVQIADLAAYTAYQNVVQLPKMKFMWDWWPDHLPHAAPPIAM